MTQTPPPYSNISGLYVQVNKHVNTTLANYNGNGKPGQLVVDTANYQLYISNANGNLNIVSGGGGNGTPGGTGGQIQFNSSGNFGATANLTYTEANGTTSIRRISSLASSNLDITTNTGENINITPATNSEIYITATGAGGAVQIQAGNNIFSLSQGTPETEFRSDQFNVQINSGSNGDAYFDLTSAGIDSVFSVATGNGAWTIDSVNGNLTGTGPGATNVNFSVDGNANIGSNLRVAGNVTGNYFIGNGSQLTGIPGGSSLVNGNSNVVVTANSDVKISVAGTANILDIGTAALNYGGGCINIGANSTGGPTCINMYNPSDAYNNYIGGQLGQTTDIVFRLPKNNGSNAQYLSTDGTGNTSWTTISSGSSLVNGNSNVIVTANGNVTTSVAGNANIFTVTGVGANITGGIGITQGITANTLVSNANTTVGGNLRVTVDSILSGNANITGNLKSSNTVVFSNLTQFTTSSANANLMMVDGGGNVGYNSIIYYDNVDEELHVGNLILNDNATGVQIRTDQSQANGGYIQFAVNPTGSSPVEVLRLTPQATVKFFPYSNPGGTTPPTATLGAMFFNNQANVLAGVGFYGCTDGTNWTKFTLT